MARMLTPLPSDSGDGKIGSPEAFRLGRSSGSADFEEKFERGVQRVVAVRRRAGERRRGEDQDSSTSVASQASRTVLPSSSRASFPLIQKRMSLAAKRAPEAEIT